MGMLLLSLFVIGCSSGEDNFTLYISDQSYELSPVGIKVYIDDKLVINEDFAVGNQHNWKKFSFKLSNGKHTLKAVTAEGIIIEEEILLLKDTYAVLNYWKDSAVDKFTFDTYHHEPMFM